MGTESGINQIGLGPVQSEEHVEFLMDGGKRGEVISGVMSSTAQDGGGSPAYPTPKTLRKGLVVARLAASGKFMEYVHGGLQDPAIGILMDTINLLDEEGVAQDAECRVHVMGWYDEDKLHGLDANGTTDLKAVGCLFKNDVLPT